MYRNSISFIELDAFSSLTKLNTINLTYNRLESFDNRIFEQNLHLTVVDLSGNKFMHLPNAPILRSTSLEVNELQHNEIAFYLLKTILKCILYCIEIYIEHSVFFSFFCIAFTIRMHIQQELDLKKSQLTHLHVNYFAELPNIKLIDLSENLLIVLNLAAFATNNRLQTINIAQNRIKCDEQSEMSIIWLNRNHVHVAIDDCRMY